MRTPLRQVHKFDRNGLTELNEFMRETNNALTTVEITQDGSTPENLFCDFVTVEFSAASGEQTFSHSLGRVPYGVIPTRMNLPCSFWFETTPTSAEIYLKCSEAASGTVLIF